uniref:Prolactin releasing hormone 2 n=1 Tax=Sphaeramia orbicularis TaxID=375764 RepID=A0A673B5M4_9TELE
LYVRCNLLYYHFTKPHIHPFPHTPMVARHPDIDASWYTGRGIRPVGRFGRKAVRRIEHLAFITAGAHRPTADSDSTVWITQ